MFDGERQPHEFSSLLYIDEAVTDLVHARAHYNTKGRVTPGYLGRIAVGLRMS